MRKFFLISFSIFLIDFLTKEWIRRTVESYEEISVLPFFNIIHTTNTGMAFGMLQDHNFALLVVGILLLIFIIWYGINLLKTDVLSAYFLSLVLGGAMGNLFDRIVFGRVTDFLDFYWDAMHWPTFNVADSAICTGAFLLLVRSFIAPSSRA